MMRSPLADAFEHHVWATLKIIDACESLPSEQLDTTVPGTYGSIVETLRHLVGADAAYLFVLTDGETALVEENTMNLAELRAAMEAHAEAWASVLSAGDDPETVVVRRRDDGSEAHAPLGVRLAQAVHHGTDHRSQICTALTTLGVTPPEIDVWAYAFEDDRLRELPPA